MRILFTVLVVGLVAATATVSRAQTKADEQAKVQFQQGVELYQEGKHDQAAVAFESAYKLKPSYKILFNLGQAENERGQYAAALQAYTRYLAEGESELADERLKTVKSEIKRLNALVGMVVVEYGEDGVGVFVDGKRQGETPMAGPVFVDLGDHEVVLRRGAKEVYSEVVRVGGGERVTVKVADGAQEVAGERVGSDSTQAPEAGESVEPENKRIWTWVAIGIGAAAAVGAGITGGVLASKSDSLEDNCPENQCPESEWGNLDSARTLAIATDVLVGVAAVGVAAGIVLFFVESRLGEDENVVAVTPSPVSKGAVLSFSGRF